MGEGDAILTAIRQEGLLSLTFGLAMLVAAVALGIALRNTIKQIVREATAKTGGQAKQARALRRLARAAILFALMIVVAVFAARHLLDAGAWLAVNDPYASLVLRSGPAAIPPPVP
jgi:F0F1-type ATP synthase membrane subunit c/vacuolar-type H+-ATPase subunit K